MCRVFDLTGTATRTWVKQAEVDRPAAAGEPSSGGPGGVTSDERRELARLRRENRRLQEDVDVLKRATFFPSETR